MVKMAFGGFFEAPADPASGEFVFKGVGLSPGNNDFVFRARDRAGNLSDATVWSGLFSGSRAGGGERRKDRIRAE